MSEPEDTLDEYVDPPSALSISETMTAAKAAAMTPKPTLREMIEVVTNVRCDIEDAQLRLLESGDRAEPYRSLMRRAAILASCANFLLLIDANQAAVKKVLRSAA